MNVKEMSQIPLLAPTWAEITRKPNTVESILDFAERFLGHGDLSEPWSVGRMNWPADNRDNHPFRNQVMGLPVDERRALDERDMIRDERRAAIQENERLREAEHRQERRDRDNWEMNNHVIYTAGTGIGMATAATTAITAGTAYPTVT